MRKVTRRAALCGMSGSGLAALLLPPSATSAADAPAGKGGLFVVGPFRLGEWFAKSKIQLDGPFNLGAPEPAEIFKSLNECLLYVVDQRVGKRPKDLHFADGPRLVAAGKLLHTWKGKNSSFTIQVAELAANRNTDNYDDMPPSRSIRGHVILKTAGASALGKSESTPSFGRPIVYDINGRLR